MLQPVMASNPAAAVTASNAVVTFTRCASLDALPVPVTQCGIAIDWLTQHIACPTDGLCLCVHKRGSLPLLTEWNEACRPHHELLGPPPRIVASYCQTQ